MKIKPSTKRGEVVAEIGGKDPALLASQTTPSNVPFAIEKILVPIDFSDCALKALQYAIPFARQFQARLILAFVMPVNYFVGSEFGPVDFPVPEMEWREQSLKELQAMAAREVGHEVNYEAVVRQGQPAHEIADCAREMEVDLIVISTHGRTGLRHVLVGSVAENVVRYASCPVLVVREHEHDFLQPPESEPAGSS